MNYKLKLELIARHEIKEVYSHFEDFTERFTEEVKTFNKPKTKSISEKELKRFLQDNSPSLECHIWFLKEKGYINFTYVSYKDPFGDYIYPYLLKFKVNIKEIK